MIILFLTKKYKLTNLEQRFLQKLHYYTTFKYMKELAFLGFEYSFLYPLSLTLESNKNYFFTLPLLRINEFVKTRYYIREYSILCGLKKFNSFDNYTIYNKLSRSYKQLNPFFTALHILTDTKAKASWSQIYQLIGIRGYLESVEGNNVKLPVLNNFSKGLNIYEYFISCLGARKGIVDTAIKTADSGYLTKRLVEVIQELSIKEYFCGVKSSFKYSNYSNAQGISSSPYFLILHGKCLKSNIINNSTKEIIVHKNKYLSSTLLQKLYENKHNFAQLSLFSIKLCNLERTICSKCFGLTSESKNFLAKNIGVLTGQTIGEPNTQLTLRTFHTGGSSNINYTKLHRFDHSHLLYAISFNYRICSFIRNINIKRSNYAFTILTFNRKRLKNFTTYVVKFNKSSFISYLHSKWIYIRSYNELCISFFKTDFPKLYQKYSSFTKAYSKFNSLNVSLCYKTLSLLVKNKWDRWIFININKSLSLKKQTQVMFKLNPYSVRQFHSLNLKTFGLRFINFKRILRSTITTNLSLLTWIYIENSYFLSNRFYLKRSPSTNLNETTIFKYSNQELKYKKVLFSN